RDYAAGVTEQRLTLGDGRYQVSLCVAVDAAQASECSAQTVDLSGCLGEGRAGFVAAPDPGWDGSEPGCYGLTQDAVDLAALSGAAPQGHAIAVPLPSLADVGVYSTGGSSKVPFRWENATFPDAWGRAVSGVEARFVETGGSCSAVVGPATSTVDEGNAQLVVRYQGAGIAPTAESWPGCLALVAAGAANADQGVLFQVMRFGATDGFPCLLRSPTQGRTLTPGDALDDLCPAWGAGWRVGAAQERDGLRVVPVARAARNATSVDVAVIWFAQGVAYPVEARRVVASAGAPARGESYRLLGLAPGAAPFPSASAPLPPGPAAARPIDPLHGPSDGGGRIPFPLASAVDAARASLALRDLQGVLARPDAALVGARLDTRVEHATGARTHEWRLIFSARGAAPVAVVCKSVAGPLAACSPSDPGSDSLVDDLGWPSRDLGAEDVPSTGAGFEDALERWAQLDPSSAGQPAEFALYRAWSDGSGPAQVGVGSPVAESMTPVAVDPALNVTRAAVSLADGRVYEHVLAMPRVATLGDLPSAIGLAGGVAGKAPGDALPSRVLVVAIASAGALAAIALLAFLGLFARLRGSAVLDSAARQRILRRVSEDPGIHAAALAAELGSGHGLGEHHLAVLVREGHLVAV